MKVNLGKVVNLKKNSKNDISSKVDLSKIDLQDLKTKVDDFLNKQKDCLEPEKKPPRSPPKDGKKTKKVQVRPPRQYKVKDLQRIAKKVLENPCNQVDAAASMVAAFGFIDWVNLLIRIIAHIRDIYALFVDYFDFSDYSGFVRELAGDIEGIPVIGLLSGIVNGIADVIDLPMVLLKELQPIDDFLKEISDFLKQFKEIVAKFI